MAKKPTTTATTPKSRKPRTPIEKVFVVSLGDSHRLVAGVSKRNVETAVWKKPAVRIATPPDLRELTSAGMLIETSEPATQGQMRTDAPAEQAGGEAGSGASES